MTDIPVVTKLLDALLALEVGDTQEVRLLVRESIETIYEAAEELRVNADDMLAMSDRIKRERDTARGERDAARGENEDLRQALQDYAGHQSWRCEYRTRYRTRYQKCECGLDDLMRELGLPLVPPDDPEAKKGE